MMGSRVLKDKKGWVSFKLKKKKRTRALANIWGIKNTEEKEQGQLYPSDPGLREDGVNRPHGA